LTRCGHCSAASELFAAAIIATRYGASRFDALVLQTAAIWHGLTDVRWLSLASCNRMMHADRVPPMPLKMAERNEMHTGNAAKSSGRCYCSSTTDLSSFCAAAVLPPKLR
jgi:hypothetical protein